MIPETKDFLDESRALHALVSPLDERELVQATAFKDWTITMVVRHLHVWNQAALLSLTDEVAIKAYLEEVQSALRTMPLPAFEERYLDGLRGAALLSRWRDGCERLADAFADADPAQRVVWAGPSMSARSSITARLMETWAHGQEVYDLLGVVRKNTDRIRGIVVLGVNTFGWSFKVRGEEPPGAMPYLVLSAPSGEIWTYGEASESERIEGPAEAFCQVVTQTRNIADTDLVVRGAVAAEWMAKAQCFAGAPAVPPPPNTRVTAS